MHLCARDGKPLLRTTECEGPTVQYTCACPAVPPMCPAPRFQTDSASPRRPSCNNLYDVFSNIRDDELGERVWRERGLGMRRPERRGMYPSAGASV